MGHGEGAKLALAGRREPNHHRSAIITAADSLDQAALLQTIDQPHGAMVPYKEVSGQGADRGSVRARQCADRQQHLVLLRLEARLPCGLLAEVEELADAITKLAQRGVIFGAQVIHMAIIS